MTQLEIRTLDLPSFVNQIHRQTIGFDRMFEELNRTFSNSRQDNYPPYNIRKTGDNTYTIELAVAGFGQGEIDIELDGGRLVVRGNASADADTTDYIFKGIAGRAFTRSFAIDDKIEVKNAELFNGMLRIMLERIIPEEKKPKKVPVKTKGEKQFLQEDRS